MGFPAPEVCLLSAVLHWLACALTTWVRTQILVLIGLRRAGPAGLISAENVSPGISREPGLQRRKRLAPGGLAQSCGCLLDPPDKHLVPGGHRTAPPAGEECPSACKNNLNKVTR